MEKRLQHHENRLHLTLLPGDNAEGTAYDYVRGSERDIRGSGKSLPHFFATFFYFWYPLFRHIFILYTGKNYDILMTTSVPEGRKALVSAAIFFLLAGMLILSGCTTEQPEGTPTTTPPTTAVPTTSVPIDMKDMTVYNETANGTTVKIPLGSGGLIVQLAENPSTGFAWNATVTSGLAIVDDFYEADPLAQGRVGAGGSHSWVLSGTAAGEQKFSAVYKRSWENVTGSEDTFVLNVLVEKI